MRFNYDDDDDVEQGLGLQRNFWLKERKCRRNVA